MLGAPVVRALLESEHEVRVLTRRPEICERAFPHARIVEADVTRPETLAGAVSGCDALHVSLRGTNDWHDYEAVEHRGLADLLTAARGAGVAHVTYLSGAGHSDGNEHLPGVRIKLVAEAAVRASGIPFTVFRATHFMESLALFVQGGRATVLGRQPHRYHYLAAADFASQVCAALVTPAARNQVLYAFGPEAWTMREALSAYVHKVCPQLRVGALPLPIARLIAALTGNRDLGFAAELFAGFNEIGEEGDPGPCDALLGKPATTLSRWLSQAPPPGTVRLH